MNASLIALESNESANTFSFRRFPNAAMTADTKCSSRRIFRQPLFVSQLVVDQGTLPVGSQVTTSPQTIVER
jgi:hypothetical protein